MLSKRKNKRRLTKKSKKNKIKRKYIGGSNPKIAIITAIFGGYDNLKDISPINNKDLVTWFCFTDNTEIKNDNYTIINTPYHINNLKDEYNQYKNYYKNTTDIQLKNMMSAKYYKIKLHEIDILKDFDYFIWIDGSLNLQPVFIDNIMNLINKNYDLINIIHPDRSTVKDEVAVCIVNNRYKIQRIDIQYNTYLEDGFKDNVGLFACGFFIRKNIERNNNLFDLWWMHNLQYSYQDQLSYPYCLWKQGIAPDYIIKDNIFNNKNYCSVGAHSQTGGNIKYTAIIVEPRKHRALSFVIRNVLENLNSEWNLIIYHGTLNKDFVNNLLETELNIFRNRISLESLNVEDLSRAAINKLLLDYNFINSIPAEKYLMVQCDTMINPNNKDLINKFLKYDYVGASMCRQAMVERRDMYIKQLNIDISPEDLLKEGIVGNGGFTFRKKSKMLEILKDLPSEMIEKIPDEGLYGEDLIFSIGSKNFKPYKPSLEEAKEFAIEDCYTEKSFALHKPWLHLTKDELDQLKRDCPGLQTLIDLQ